MQKDVATMDQLAVGRAFVAYNIGVLKCDHMRQPGLPAARLGDLKHVVRQIDAMHPRAERLCHQKRGAAQAAADIEDLHIWLEYYQAEDITRRSLPAGADEIAPVDRLVFANFAQAVLALIESRRGRIGHDGILLCAWVTAAG